jgi:hypothetical protein
MCCQTPAPIYSGSALFRWLDKQFHACSTTVRRLRIATPPMRALISSFGRAGCSVGRYDRPCRPLEQSAAATGSSSYAASLLRLCGIIGIRAGLLAIC